MNSLGYLTALPTRMFNEPANASAGLQHVPRWFAASRGHSNGARRVLACGNGQ